MLLSFDGAGGLFAQAPPEVESDVAGEQKGGLHLAARRYRILLTGGSLPFDSSSGFPLNSFLVVEVI